MIQICQMINIILYGFWHLPALDKKHLHGISMLMAHFSMALGVELTLFLLFAISSLLLTIARRSLLLLGLCFWSQHRIVLWRYPVGYEKYNLTCQVNANTPVGHKVGCLSHPRYSLHHSLICIEAGSLFFLMADTPQTDFLTIFAALISLHLSLGDQC
jgi:hypothetical protein